MVKHIQYPIVKHFRRLKDPRTNSRTFTYSDNPTSHSMHLLNHLHAALPSTCITGSLTHMEVCKISL